MQNQQFQEEHEGLKGHGVVLYEEVAPLIKKLSEEEEKQPKEKPEQPPGETEQRYTMAEFYEHIMNEDKSHNPGCLCSKARKQLEKRGHDRGFINGVKAAEIAQRKGIPLSELLKV